MQKDCHGRPPDSPGAPVVSRIASTLLEMQALGREMDVTSLPARCSHPTERARAGVVLPRVWLGLAALS